jgi:hypothetical protein
MFDYQQPRTPLAGPLEVIANDFGVRTETRDGILHFIDPLASNSRLWKAVRKHLLKHAGDDWLVIVLELTKRTYECSQCQDLLYYVICGHLSLQNLTADYMRTLRFRRPFRKTKEAIKFFESLFRRFPRPPCLDPMCSTPERFGKGTFVATLCLTFVDAVMSVDFHTP